MPKKIKIGGHIYQIKCIADREIIDGNRNPASSLCRNNVIWIDMRQAESRQASCLLHEIIECLNYDYELELPHEKICLLESALYQVFKDNKL